MKFTKQLLGIAAIAFALASILTFANPASATQTGQVCSGNKVDVSGNHKTVTITAPEGKLISAYCVKAGSVNQGLGPQYVKVDPPQKSVTITHSSGKDISHYSVTFVDTPTTPTTPKPTVPPTDPKPTVPPAEAGPGTPNQEQPAPSTPAASTPATPATPVEAVAPAFTG